VWSCWGLRWDGRCWPCCPSDSATSRNDGQLRRPRSWGAGVASLSGSAAVQAVFSWVWPPVMFGLVVWMFLRVRRQLRSRIGRWLLYPVLVVLMVASVGGAYETVRESLDEKAYPMPGQMVDVGGHRLHLYCTGSGSPTVVLEPGGGASSSDFGWIAPVVARDTTVCVYDRAGRGWSDAADGPQDGVHIAADLHTLLDRADVPGPYVLAGHSFGGLYVQSFAAQFPDQVAGLVLLDSTAPKPGPAQPINAGSGDMVDRVAALAAASAHLGVGRLIAMGSYGSLPPRFRDEARANSSTAAHLGSFIEEFFGGADTSMQQASALTDLNGKPLIVLTADEGINDNQWQSKQDQLATLQPTVSTVTRTPPTIRSSPTRPTLPQPARQSTTSSSPSAPPSRSPSPNAMWTTLRRPRHRAEAPTFNP
jgi:pimeloyl-ACP methyl ester carboxylesterase